MVARGGDFAGTLRKPFIKGCDLLLFGRAQHIGLSPCFVQRVTDYRQSILKGVVESAF